MPKLKLQDVERNQLKIEQAALRLFTRRGFHGTSVRDIAEAAGVSLGNIYNYYPNKDELFARLVARSGERMAALQQKKLGPLLGCMEPAALDKLARAVRQIVYDNPDYWRLMYIDVTEFGNRHFAHSFRDLTRNLKRFAGASWQQGARHCRQDVDPALAFTAIYLQFFTYFLVEKLFGGKHHLGMSDDRAVAQLIRIYTAGVSNGGDGRQSRPSAPPAARRSGAVARRNQS